ncbi:response regulator [Rhodopseudomonas palustris]|uniref:Response regulator n=1 Tax=Rhodopseudomonas palustris TaxID=1076 RepID=A0A418V1P9_RHOPL|nr:response regulator [Rhodopseudomonas palustris]
MCESVRHCRDRKEARVLPGPLLSIIDDDDDVRQSLQDLVESVGYTARLFESGEAFLASDALLESQCIISDIQMAGMTGVALAEQLARRGNRTPVILISAFATEEMLRGLRNANVIAVLPKPLQPNALIDQIKSALAGRS